MNTVNKLDDIPIQDEQQTSSGNVPLTSISEEDSADKFPIGSRNIGIRSSKESGVGGIKAQAQKALIAGFKKVKDKDKDKEKEKEKELNVGHNNALAKNSSLITKNGSIDMSASGTSISATSGATLVGIAGESGIKPSLIPPKVPIRRDKRTSIQINDVQDNIEKNLGLIVQTKSSTTSGTTGTGTIKHNQLYSDSTILTNSNPTKNDIIQMQILTNGNTNFVIEDTVEASIISNLTNQKNFDSIDSNYCDASDSVDSSNEISLTMPTQISRPSITAIINSNIMDLQQQEQYQQKQQSLQKPRIQSEV